ncbi:hypothetical protein C8R45DRAFT_928069 [Mycena sanguinolenta]|nr:hypothetical protein C8R45DRAFT_928069 [Mycena sanguinolenta]
MLFLNAPLLFTDARDTTKYDKNDVRGDGQFDRTWVLSAIGNPKVTASHGRRTYTSQRAALFVIDAAVQLSVIDSGAGLRSMARLPACDFLSLGVAKKNAWPDSSRIQRHTCLGPTQICWKSVSKPGLPRFRNLHENLIASNDPRRRYLLPVTSPSINRLRSWWYKFAHSFRFPSHLRTAVREKQKLIHAFSVGPIWYVRFVRISIAR